MEDCLTYRNDTTLTDVITQGIERADLDAHLACLALTYTFSDLSRTPFAASIGRIKSIDCQHLDDPRLRPHDVAVAGVRIALDWEAGQARDNFAILCEREIRRKPVGALETLATDPRLLVGVCAGSSKTEGCRQFKKQLWNLAEDYRNATSVRPWQYVLACWAHRLLAESNDYHRVSEDLSRYLVRLKGQLSRNDRSIAMWAISQRNILIPNVAETDLADMEMLYRDLRQVIRRDERLLDSAETLEMAFVYDAMANGQSLHDNSRRPVQSVVDVIEVFDRAAISLGKERRKDKHPYVIVDEYDVQDLFYAMLLPSLPDLEREEPTGKNAGSSKRIDFVSRQGRVAIELKYIEKADQAPKIADDLKKDIESYHIHPYCHTLVCFVYDPDRQITNAPIIERDLTGSRIFDGKPMEVITRIRPH